MIQINIDRPDDWHLHLRDGDALRTVLPHSAARFARAIVMPNLRPPVVNTELADAYRRRILAALPSGTHFEPLMTLYLTDETTPQEIHRARASGFIHGVKLYPAGATTHSDAGVTRLERIYPALEAMAEVDLPLLIHAEVTDPEVDIFDREKAYIDRDLMQIRRRFPGLRIVFEHITTEEAVQFVRDDDRTAATLTAHHLLYDRNAMLAGGIRPHFYCLPVLKRERHRRALVEAAISGDPRFFLGTDSAPHPVEAKENACGCAGCYTAHAAIELYVEVFETAGALERLEGFASHHGADFYGLPRNRERVTLRREPWAVPGSYPFGVSKVVPLRAGEEIPWRLIKDDMETGG